jgi:demethylmenaquinone methyltransferase / 2-methoxy-6-polyprenyl-1,4-benzoquinol methylase
MFDTIAPRYDLVNRVMTFGLDRGWRRSSVSSLLLPPGSKVLDLACGTGDLCRDLDAAGMAAVGVDLSMGMLACARTKAPLLQADALQLPFPGRSFDGVVSGFALRNFVALQPVLSELARVTRPGGRLALLDVSTPDNVLLRRGHALYFGQVVPRLGGLLSDRAAYAYLPKSVAYLPSNREMLDLIAAAGFNDVRRRLLSGGVTQLLTATCLGSHA